MVALVIICACLSGCASSAAVLVTPTPLPTLAPTSTPDIGFAVVVTPVGEPTVTPTPEPTSTPFVVPSGPYIELVPSTGPPATRRLIVRGGHLPPSAGVQLGWSRDGKSAPITTPAGTDSHGRLLTQFVVPAAPPGTYHVLLLLGGVRYASAPYVVSSRATLTVSVSAVSGGESLTIRGRRFLPRIKLLLIAYPIDAGGKPVVVGKVRSGHHGAFKYSRTVSGLALGQYTLRAWSNDALAAQMAETFFQVVI